MPANITFTFAHTAAELDDHYWLDWLTEIVTHHWSRATAPQADDELPAIPGYTDSWRLNTPKGTGERVQPHHWRIPFKPTWIFNQTWKLFETQQISRFVLWEWKEIFGDGTNKYLVSKATLWLHKSGWVGEYIKPFISSYQLSLFSSDSFRSSSSWWLRRTHFGIPDLKKEKLEKFFQWKI